MLSIAQFKAMCGVTKIQLFKGKGREFGQTPIGKVFAAQGLDWNKEVFVIENDGSTKPALKGTFWFVNSTAQLSREV
jgi:hypothetical protein